MLLDTRFITSKQTGKYRIEKVKSDTPHYELSFEMQHVIGGASWEIATEDNKPIAFTSIEEAKKYAHGIRNDREIVYEGNVYAKL